MSHTPSLALYHFPGACSMVSRVALAEAGLEYDLNIVNLDRNE
jgi:glutathione S-transferase